MLRISLRARLLTSLLALFLLLPVIGLRWQQRADLEKFHNRTLHEMPQGGFLADPAAWFRDARAWLADRPWPIRQAALLQKKLKYFLLHTPPQRRVTLGSDGFIFLNGYSDETVNGLFQLLCVTAHRAELGAALEKVLPVYAAYARERGVALDIVIVPTLITLYGDRLPPSVPLKYREACAARAAGQSPLPAVQAPPGLHFIYPFAPMHAAREDAGFFPKAHWHAVGMSLKVVRDAYLAQLGAAAPPGETLEAGLAPSEIMSSYNIIVKRPIWFVRNPAVQPDDDYNSRLRPAVAELFRNAGFGSKAYRNSAPVLDESVLMVSDSYGNRASEVFAGGFRELVQMANNEMDEAQLPAVLDRSLQLRKTDRIILLLQEGGIDTVLGWAPHLARATKTEAVP
jgi:hypothetical protein